MFDIDAALSYVVEREGSDLHVKVPSPPVARIHGELAPIDGSQVLGGEDTGGGARRPDASTPPDANLIEEFAEDSVRSTSPYSVPSLSRFRVDAFHQRGDVGVVCRAIPFQVRTIADLGLPEVVRKVAEEPRGIILLTGPTGSGEIIDLAAMIDHIDSTRARHIVTLEDPIEYLPSRQRSIINHRRGRLGHGQLAAIRGTAQPQHEPDGELREHHGRALSAPTRASRALNAAHAGCRDDQPDHRLSSRTCSQLE